MILINPQFNRIKKLGIFSQYVPLSLPISLGILAGHLLAKGKKAKILDDQIKPITGEVLKECTKDLETPYLFGISCFTAGIGRGYEIAELIKKVYPDSYVIMGGIHPTVLPEEVLQNKQVDIVVRKEGEETIIKLYEALKNKQDYTHILGISYKNKNGEMVHNPDAPLFQNLNLLPNFSYNLFAEHIDKYNLGFILSSRGCPYDCIFCSQRQVTGRSYRFFETKRVVEEIDLLINKYKQIDINFFDDNFIVNKERTKELCNLMYQNGFPQKATFTCQARGDAVDEEILEHLKKAGFTTIGFGLETSSERLMKLINKGETVEQNIKAIKLAKKYGFNIMGSFIFGLPTETHVERYQAYQLAKKLDLDFIRFNNATPYPGTELYKMALLEGRLKAGDNWENLSACGTFSEGPFSQAELAYCPAGTSEKELRRDILRANFFFWLTPKRILKILTRGSVPGGWFVLPPKWYLKPKEIYYITLLGLRTGLSIIKMLFI